MNSPESALPSTAAGRSKCGICNSQDTKTFIDHAFDYITNDCFSVLRCFNCGTCFTAPQPSDLGRYYPGRYRDYGRLTTVVLHTLYKRRVRTWSRLFQTPGTILEVGCGAGYMLKAFRNAGWIAKGTERTPEAAEIARTRHGLEVVATDIKDLPRTDFFDLILLFQVLEHVTRPGDLVRDCFNRLKPGGVLAIGVPNMDSWQAIFGRQDWLHLDIPRHLFHFDPASLERLLRNSGFVDIRIDFVSWEHDPFGWIQTLQNKCFRRRNALLRYLSGMDPLDLRSAAAVGVAAVLAPLSILLAVLSWLFRRGALSSATARKPAAAGASASEEL